MLFKQRGKFMIYEIIFNEQKVTKIIFTKPYLNIYTLEVVFQDNQAADLFARRMEAYQRAYEADGDSTEFLINSESNVTSFIGNLENVINLFKVRKLFSDEALSKINLLTAVQHLIKESVGRNSIVKFCKQHEQESNLPTHNPGMFSMPS